MAYKFRLGAATLSGSLVQEGDLTVSGSTEQGQAAVNLDVQGLLKHDGTTVLNADRDLVNLVDIDGTGDLTMGTIGMTGFTVDADGDTALKSLAVDNSSTIGCDADVDIMTLAAQSLVLANDVDFNVAKASGLQIAGVAVTSTAAELNYVDVTAGTATASKAVVLDGSKNIATLGTVGCAAITSTGASSLGSISSVGAVTSTAAITAGTSFIIGSADLNEADMEQIDGVTAGTAAASKAVVLDGSKNIATLGTVGCGAITSTGASVMGSLNIGGTLACDTSFTIDAVVLNATELGYVDGVTAGTAIASKAVVLDASKDVTGVNNLTASFFKGDGSALTGISSDDVDTTTDNTSNTRYIPFVENATSTNGESILIDSALSVNPSTGVFTIAGSAPSLVIGAAAMVEADLEKLDGITNGTAAASKAVVLDASKNIATLGTVGCGAITSTGASSLGSISSVGAVTSTAAITAGTSFIIGSADLNEADMEKLDGITNGTAAASKAVVLDGSKDISGLNDVSAASFAATDFTAYASESGRFPLINASKVLVDDAGFTYSNDRGLEGYNYIAVSSSASGSSYLGDGMLAIMDADENDVFLAGAGSAIDMGYSESTDESLFKFSISGGQAGNMHLITDSAKINFGEDFDVNLLHIPDTGLRLNGGMGLSFRDGAINICSDADGDLDIGADSAIDFNVNGSEVGAFNSAGLTLGGTLTAASLGTATVDLTADLMIINDGAGGVIKNTSLANYATALAAGANEGLKSTAGRLAVDLSDLVAGDFTHGSWYNSTIAFCDVNDSDLTKKDTIADFITKIAGSGLTATNGVLSSDASPTPTDHGDAAGTLVEGMNFSDEVFTAARSWTLPASPDVGDVVTVKAPTNAGTYNLTIVKAGSQKIDGVAQDLIIESNNGAVSLVYAKADYWVIS